MKKFIMTAESNPHNFENWFDGFVESLEFEADNISEAQKYLDDECAKAGTNEDLNYELYAPIAQEIENQ